MKKYILKISLLIFTVALVLSCNDKFLDRFPLDKISNENSWNTAKDLEMFSNGLYNMCLDERQYYVLPGFCIGSTSLYGMSSIYMDCMTDNMATTHSRTLYYQRIRAGKHAVPSTSEVAGWKWVLLRSCNIFLDNYKKANISLIDKNKYAGEVRLIRALFYFDKVKKYGNVPWIGRSLNVDSPELFAARDPREMVMDSVLADLNFAISGLPDKWNNDSPGRLNKWCALAAKSRICLYEGTLRKYQGGTNSTFWLNEAVNASQQIISTGPFNIYSTGDEAHDYRFLHTRTGSGLAGNPEVIYWRKYDGIVIGNNLDYFDLYNGGASKSFVDDYLCTDGLPITLSPLYKGDNVIEDEFVNRDPRMRQTILYPPDQPIIGYSGGDTNPYPRLRGMSGYESSMTGYTIIKFYDLDSWLNITGNAAQDAIVFKFSEVLLNFAEAKAELGTITQANMDISINKLRDRVKMPHLNIANVPIDSRYTGDGVSPLIVEIRRERRIELFADGLRYNDLMRWKQGKKLEIPTMGMRYEVSNRARYPKANVQFSTNPVTGKTYIDVYKGTDFAVPVFDDTKHYLMPLPTDALSSNPKLLQNPGW
jgi:hypothetical protein